MALLTVVKVLEMLEIELWSAVIAAEALVADVCRPLIVVDKPLTVPDRVVSADWRAATELDVAKEPWQVWMAVIAVWSAVICAFRAMMLAFSGAIAALSWAAVIHQCQCLCPCRWT